jgi:hypothetical protein
MMMLVLLLLFYRRKTKPDRRCSDARCSENCQLRRLRHQHPKCKRCERLFEPEESFYVVSGERDSWRYKKAFSQSNLIFVWNLY